jgi:uncharacterized membrane protein
MIIIVMASAIRLYNPVFRSIWGDESHSIYSAMEFSKHNIVTSSLNILNDAHLPAYFVLLSTWIGLFGVGEYALRLLSVILGIASVIAFYFQTKEMFDEYIARISAFLLALSPLAVMHSQEIRMYGLLLLFTIFSSVYFWRILSGKRAPSNIILYVLFTVLLLLTHIYAVLLLFAQVLISLKYVWKERNIKSAIQLIGPQLFAGLLVSPLYITLATARMGEITSNTAEMAFAVFPSFIKPFLYVFVLTLGETVAPWNFLITIPAALLFGYLLFVAVLRIKDERVQFLFTVSFIPVIIAAIFLRPTMPKYLIISLPFYLMIISYSLSLIGNIKLRILLLACIAMTQLFALDNYFTLKEYHNSNQMEPWRQVASIIEEKHQAGDVVVASDHYIVGNILNYYLNLSDKRSFAVYTLEKNFENSVSVNRIKGKRVWFISHILDDRMFPPGYIKDERAQISKRYTLTYDKKFIPYQDTLVSKLPIKRHQEGSSRIELSLYKEKR